MARVINVKVKQNLTITDGKVKKIFETTARKCGNGAIIYVPKENIGDKFYVIIVDNGKEIVRTKSRKKNSVEELRKQEVRLDEG